VVSKLHFNVSTTDTISRRLCETAELLVQDFCRDIRENLLKVKIPRSVCVTANTIMPMTDVPEIGDKKNARTKNDFYYDGRPPFSILKIFVSDHVTVMELQIWCCVLNFIIIG